MLALQGVESNREGAHPGGSNLDNCMTLPRDDERYELLRALTVEYEGNGVKLDRGMQVMSEMVLARQALNVFSR